MRKPGGKRRPRLLGRHLLTIGALALFAVSAYELWIRAEDFWAWTEGVRHLSAVRGTSFLEDLGIIFETPRMRALGCKMAFLLIAILYASLCLARRNRSAGAWVLMILDGGLLAAGAYMELYSFQPSDWAQTLKLAPMALILAGCAVNLAHGAARRRRGRAQDKMPKAMMK